MKFSEAKAQILDAMRGLPQQERVDGKCLLVNSTLAGILSGQLVAGLATHQTGLRVPHVWVEINEKTYDVLEDYYFDHKLGDGYDLFGETVWEQALCCAEYGNGIAGIDFWRMYRGYGVSSVSRTP
tara:strand:- start:1402 stop:1779 length:378 start_codon:yes stop_codon:yes gene_type:complete